MNRILPKIAIFAGLAIAVLAMVILAHSTSRRSALRRYKAELRAQGERLTRAELDRSRSTNLNDTMAVLTNATPKLVSAPLVPGILEIRKHVRPGEARALWMEEKPASGSITWTDFSQETRTNWAALEDIRQALRTPAAHAESCGSLFVAIRAAGQWLAGAAILDLHEGHLEEALRNLEALAALAQLARDEYPLVSQMIRVAVAGLGLTASWEALQAPGWTEPQLARLQMAWQEVDLLRAVENGLVGERVLGAEMWNVVRQPGGYRKYQALVSGSASPTLGTKIAEGVFLPAYKLTTIEDDELFHLKFLQQSVEAVRSLQTNRPWPEVKTNVDRDLAQVQQRLTSPQRYQYPLSSVMIPNFPRAIQTCVRTETERRLTVTAIALKRFQLRHGTLPESLDALVPEVLPKRPIDCMSGRPLAYHMKPAGGWPLYSVGEDGQDNGGDPTPMSGTNNAGFWDGRDAVWPSIANEK
jgi:hypothetical protein